MENHDEKNDRFRHRNHLFGAAGSAMRFYEVSDKGDWPRPGLGNWSRCEKQARTLVGPQRLSRHYAIPFAKREEFESAWPQLLKVKSKGLPSSWFMLQTFFLATAKRVSLSTAPPAGQEENPATGTPPTSNWSLTGPSSI